MPRRIIAVMAWDTLWVEDAALPRCREPPGAMNGRQLSDEARRRRTGLKVLLATGYAGDAIIHAGRLEPDDSLMSKPFSFADLTNRVRDALDG
jgi:CheY-like chemotaxis protein